MGRSFIRYALHRKPVTHFLRHHMPAASSKRSVAPCAATINDCESPLAWLRRRKDRDGEALISQAQFDAGERLRADFWFAQMTPRMTVNWSAAPPSQRGRRAGMVHRSDGDLINNIAAARERVRRALAGVGPELAGVLVDVCCHLKGLEETERAVGWPQRAGKVILGIALTALARHYGIESVPPATRSRAACVSHWGAEDYRPIFELPTD
jgi:hypothetical protein